MTASAVELDDFAVTVTTDSRDEALKRAQYVAKAMKFNSDLVGQQVRERVREKTRKGMGTHEALTTADFDFAGAWGGQPQLKQNYAKYKRDMAVLEKENSELKAQAKRAAAYVIPPKQQSRATWGLTRWVHAGGRRIVIRGRAHMEMMRATMVRLQQQMAEGLGKAMARSAQLEQELARERMERFHLQATQVREAEAATVSEAAREEEVIEAAAEPDVVEAEAEAIEAAAGPEVVEAAPETEAEAEAEAIEPASQMEAIEPASQTEAIEPASQMEAIEAEVEAETEDIKAAPETEATEAEEAIEPASQMEVIEDEVEAEVEAIEPASQLEAIEDEVEAEVEAIEPASQMEVVEAEAEAEMEMEPHVMEEILPAAVSDLDTEPLSATPSIIDEMPSQASPSEIAGVNDNDVDGDDDGAASSDGEQPAFWSTSS